MDESATATLIRPEDSPPPHAPSAGLWRTYVTDVRDEADRAR